MKIESMKMHEVGIGTDIEAIQRFSDPELVGDDAFLGKIFADAEITYCRGMKDPSQHFTARFAAKEAVIKALGSLGVAGVPYSEIAIVNDEQGVPGVNLGDPSLRDIRIQLSISHCDRYAIAFCLALKVDGHETD